MTPLPDKLAMNKRYSDAVNVCRCCGQPQYGFTGLCEECSRAVETFIRMRRHNLTK